HPQKTSETGRVLNGPPVAGNDPVGEFRGQRVEHLARTRSRSVIAEKSFRADRAARAVAQMRDNIVDADFRHGERFLRRRTKRFCKKAHARRASKYVYL